MTRPVLLHVATFGALKRWRAWPVAVVLVLSGCAAPPLSRYTTDGPPLVLLPAHQAGIKDQRGRFRETYCAVLENKRDTPDYRTCDEALTRVGTEPSGSGRPVNLGPARLKLKALVVPGVGYECFEQWLQSAGTAAAHVARFGYAQEFVKVDALSGTANNARQIRDAIMATAAEAGPPRLVLIGYSKGAPDILEALVTYPEIRGRVAAVVSAAGAVGGSALANDAEQYQANLLQHFPGSTCGPGDGGAVASMRPAVRQAWLAANPLPSGPRYYSLVTYPQPDRISAVLKGSYDKLAQIDARNDSQVVFYDQVIPGSTLIGYLNADHWAIAVPIARKHDTVGSVFVTQNAYPREALLEAVLRYIDEDLATAR